MVWLKHHNPLYSHVNLAFVCEDSTIHLGRNLSLQNNLEECVVVPVNPCGSCVVENVFSKTQVNIQPNTNLPLNILETCNGEAMAFPWLFPFGCNDFNIEPERPIKLNPNMYFPTRLYNSDTRF